MNPALKTALHCGVDNFLRRIPVVLHRGGAGSMLVAGPDRWSHYLPNRFFGDGSHEQERLGCCWTWQLPRVIRQWREAADLAVVRVDRFSARRFPAAEYLRVPEWVRMVAPVPVSNREFRSYSARSDLRIVQRNKLTWRISHDPAELAAHLADDYGPYTRLRHGQDAFIQAPRETRRSFRKGGLLVVERAGAPIARLVFELEPQQLIMATIACVGADEGLLKQGALAGVYHFSFEYARSLGLTQLDMRGCRPCLRDPLFFVKRKYDAAVEVKPDIAYDMLVRWNTADANVQRFLAASPFIFHDREGLAVVHAALGPLERLSPIPGIRQLYEVPRAAPFGVWNK
jgi:hypothetical protein